MIAAISIPVDRTERHNEYFFLYCLYGTFDGRSQYNFNWKRVIYDMVRKRNKPQLHYIVRSTLQEWK